MSKHRRMVSLSTQDVESAVLHDGLRLLSQVEVSGRRRVLAYWCARAETLPLISPKGDVLEEHPVENEPPMIKFIHERPERETAEA